MSKLNLELKKYLKYIRIILEKITSNLQRLYVIYQIFIMIKENLN
jgi:hypothetical protein